MNSAYHLCGFLIVLWGIVSCSAPSPKRQAFPQLDRMVQAHVKAGDKVVYPQLVHSPKPEYPSLPASGSVWAVMRVNNKGRVSEVQIIGEAPELYTTAIQKALAQWRFEPGKINGIPNEFPMQVKITFTPSAQSDVLKAAQTKEGLVHNPRDWFLRSTFPQLIQYLEDQSKRGYKLVPPELMKAPSDVKHPDPTKTGTVYTAFIIDPKGRPKNIHIFGDILKEFQETISKAILNAKFRPGTLNGKPHDYPTGLPFRFITHGYSDE